MSGSGPLNPYVLQVGAPRRTKMTNEERSALLREAQARQEAWVAEARVASEAQAAPEAQAAAEAQAARKASEEKAKAKPNPFGVEMEEDEQETAEQENVKQNDIDYMETKYEENPAKPVQEDEPQRSSRSNFRKKGNKNKLNLLKGQKTIKPRSDKDSESEDERQALADAEALAQQVQEEVEQKVLKSIERAENDKTENISDESDESDKDSESEDIIEENINRLKTPRPPDTLEPLSKDVYQALSKLSNTIAGQAKGILFGRLKLSFLKSTAISSLRKLSSSPGVLAENYGVPYADEECAHQFIRAFLHMHDEQLHAVIIAYLRLYYGIITEADAFTALIFALQREITIYFNLNEAWDIALLREAFMHHESTLENDPMTQYTVFMALHDGLKKLELHIVWIEWIANWKNRMKLLYAKHSPLHWIRNAGLKFKIFDKPSIDRIFTVDSRTFASEKQLLTYVAESMFGCRFIKNQDGRLIPDYQLPENQQKFLDPTHEINIKIEEGHPHFNYAKEIEASDYDVVKQGRLWQRKPKQEMYDDFLSPDREFTRGKFLKHNFNAQFSMLLNNKQYLVRWVPEIQNQILPWQQIKEYYVQIQHTTPIWNTRKKKLEHYRVEKQTFLHVGVNLSIVTKRIWSTRRVWSAKLNRINDLILGHLAAIDATVAGGVDDGAAAALARAQASIELKRAFKARVEAREERRKRAAGVATGAGDADDGAAGDATGAGDADDWAAGDYTGAGDADDGAAGDPDIIALLKAEGCDENFSADPTTKLSDSFEMVQNHAMWIEYCSNKDIWSNDNGGTQETTQLAQRLARIVYQIFTVHAIWTEVEQQLSNEATTTVNKVPGTSWDSKFPAPIYNKRKTPDGCSTYLKHVIERVNEDTRQHGHDFNHKSYMMNVILRKWLYDIEDIGVHPLKYELSTQHENKDYVDSLNQIIDHLTRQWKSEQSFFGGPATSCTYIWSVPDRPAKTLEIEKLNLMLRNNVMILTAHKCFSEKMIDLIQEAISTAYNKPGTAAESEATAESETAAESEATAESETAAESEATAESETAAKSKEMQVNILSLVSYKNNAHELLIPVIENTLQTLLMHNFLSFDTYVLDIGQIHRGALWEDFELKIEPKTHITKSIFSAWPEDIKETSLQHAVQHIEDTKQFIFDVFKFVYDSSWQETAFGANTWYVDPTTRSTTPETTVHPNTQTTSKPFEFKTHGMFPIQNNELVFFAHCELTTDVRVGADVEFRFRNVEKIGDGNCFYHAIRHSLIPSEQTRLSVTALRNEAANALTRNKDIEFYDGITYKTNYERYEDINRPNFDTYVQNVRTKDDEWADSMVVNLMPNIIRRPVIIYRRTIGIPAALSGLLRFIEYHKIGTAEQVKELRLCTTFTDFSQVFKGDKSTSDGINLYLIERAASKSVQEKAIDWARHWITKEKSEISTAESAANLSVAESRQYRPFWRHPSNVHLNIQHEQELLISEQFYGPMSEAEVRESKHWWPEDERDMGFFTEGGTQMTLNLLQELTQYSKHIPTVNYANLQPVRLLYDGKQHYDALDYVGTSEQDTRPTWLVEQLQNLAQNQERSLSEVPNLSDDQTDKIAELEQITGDREIARELLTNCEWDVTLAADKARQIFYTDNTDNPYIAYTSSDFEAEVTGIIDVGNIDLSPQEIEAVVATAPFDDSLFGIFNVSGGYTWSDSNDDTDIEAPRESKIISIQNQSLVTRISEWNRASDHNAQLSNAKYFLYLLYSDIKSLLSTATFEIMKEHVDAVTRHKMEEYEYGDVEGLYNPNVADLQSRTIECIAAVGAAGIKEYVRNNMKEVKAVAREILRNEEQTQSGKKRVAVTKSLVDKVAKAVQVKFQAQIKKQSEERDVAAKEVSNARNSGGGGGGFAEGNFELVWTPRQGNRGNGGTNGEKDGTGRRGKQNGVAKKLDAAAKKSAEGRNGQSNTPAAAGAGGDGLDSDDERSGGESEDSDRRREEDGDWGHDTEVGKGKGRNKRPKEHFDANMTNIYFVEHPRAPGTFKSMQRVPALAIPLLPEHETRLARDYGLDDAGSSCAKYAV